VNQGSCLCGSVTWELSAEPFQVFNCHCRMCQKVHGAPFGTYWFVKPDAFRWTSSTDTVLHYRSSEMLIRSSCDTCGSVVPYVGHDDSEFWVAPGGCHDHGRKADCNVFAVDNAPWHDITNGLPCHDAYPEVTGYPSVAGVVSSEGQEGTLRGSCLCGAVAYHVTEPIEVVHNCHCRRCRRGRAAAHATNGFTSYDGVQFIRGEDHLKSYKVPEAKYFTQMFCEICSSLMPRLCDERKIAVIPLGGLDDDPGVKENDNIYVASKAGWFEITDDLPVFDEDPAA